MALRAGSSRHFGAMLSVVTCFSCVSTNVCFAKSPTPVAGPDQSARDAKTSEVPLPVEILPWRRAVEQQAANLLKAAQQALALGNRVAAQRQLTELTNRFPATHAGRDGIRVLADLQGRQISDGIGRRGLGIEASGEPKSVRTPKFDPVGGWRVTISPEHLDGGDALIEAAGDRVFFDDGSADLSKGALVILKSQAVWLKSRPSVQVRIVGHADDAGTGELNMRLSHDRAMRVRQALLRLGISAKRLHVLSRGNTEPIAICTLAKCSEQNRRVVTELRAMQRAEATQN